MTAALRVQDPRKSFGEVQVLRGGSLEVDYGEMVLLTGQNGAGKSTLLDLIGGFQKPDVGTDIRLELEGRSLLGLEPWAVARLGVGRMFQAARVFDNLTVVENLAVAGGRESVTEGLATAGLKGRGAQLAGTLSLGQRRLLALAVVLGGGARLLLLDEPAANLSPQASEEMVDLLLRLRDDGMGILVIEHGHRRLAETSDRIYEIRDGVLTCTSSAPSNGTSS